LLVELEVSQGQLHGFFHFLFEGKGWEGGREGGREGREEGVRNATRRINPNLLVELEVGQEQLHGLSLFPSCLRERRVFNNRKES